MSNFHLIDRHIDVLLLLSVQEWLLHGRGGGRAGSGDLERAYAGKGSAAYHPALLLLLLIYGYATGGYSSRKIEQAIYDSLAFRDMACNHHPHHDTLANFRKHFGKECETVFVEVLQVARENPLSRFSTVSFEGTQSHANANRHRALSYGHAEVIKAHLKAEVQELLALVEQADYQAEFAARAWTRLRPVVSSPAARPHKPLEPGPRAED